MREVARLEELFALIRWCDDWLNARRTLVSRVEAQLAWFAEQPSAEEEASDNQTGADPAGTDPDAFLDSH
jgi:hypothetical protein